MDLAVTTRLTGDVAARLVDAPSGLFFEWNLKRRAKVRETAHAVPNYEFVYGLYQDLLDSDWVAPPSLKRPAYFPDPSLVRDELSLKNLQRAWRFALEKHYGKQALDIGLAIYPRSLTLFDLSKVKAHLAILQI
ncbi:MAG: hypothetical protein R3194_00315, partial [Limnobacter sp.]|nr:hypothetical protein [Limnobacter sp.]